MSKNSLPAILCVDDDPDVLEGLETALHGVFDVTIASGGAEAIVKLKTAGPFAVILSDLRMPGIDGLVFLKRAKEEAPDVVRVSLSGTADLESAVRAVNQGQIFRFLRKPCPTEQLIEALNAAVAQHRLIRAEQDLLSQTLLGSIKMLGDILALANPEAFGKTTRIRRRVADLAVQMGKSDPWAVRIAASLCLVGAVSLPTDLQQRYYLGLKLSRLDEEKIDGLPLLAAQWIRNIPRMELVQEILKHIPSRYDGGEDQAQPSGEEIPWGARAIKVELDLDTLESGGLSITEGLAKLRSQEGKYDPAILNAIAVAPHPSRGAASEAVAWKDVKVGMVLDEDVRSTGGALLVPRGHEVTPSLLARLSNSFNRISSKVKASWPDGEPTPW